MRCLVTGSAGFVGRNMVAALQQRPGVRHIVSIDLKPMTVDVDWVKPPHIHFIGDALDIFRNEDDRYDLTVHCAYHVGGRAAIDGVNMNLARNLELDAALFEWAVRTGQPRVLYFSSSSAYPREVQSKQWLDLHPIGDMRLSEGLIDLKSVEEPDADYGWAKLTGERLAARARANGVNVHVVRPASGCGPDQDDTYPFPAIAKRVRARETPLTLWGPEGQARDFIDISDVVRGALAVVDADYQEPVNLCSGRATTFGELAEMMWRETHGSLDGLKIAYDESRPTGVFYRVLDPTLMNRFYVPKISLEEMVSVAARES